MDNRPFDQLYKVGDYLVLELSTGDVFEGDYCAGGDNRIDTINTTQHNNPNKLGGVYSFYRSEIFKISLLKSKPNDTPTTSIVIKDPEDSSRIKITEDEYVRLKDMSKNYIYLEHADNRYYEAVEELTKVETIGIIALGMEYHRTANIRLLAVSTWQQVYLFDMVNFRNCYFYPELKDIFESDFVCKVIHNSGHLMDVLTKKYKVYVQNVFDTHVVDLVIEKNKNANSESIKQIRDISDCLVHYLNFPSSLLRSASETTLKKWMERPLSEKRRHYAAQLVTYLIVLKETMHRILFSEVYQAIGSYHNYYSNLNSAEFSLKVQSDEVSEDIDKLIPILKRNTIVNTK